MITESPKVAVKVLLSVIFLYCTSSVTASAVADSLDVAVGQESVKTPFVDRIAIRTNALDWLLTIPNIGVEFDLTGSEFNSMTLGLSAKYNWNTYHAYTPPTVFNLFDVRPEFRYYYRTRKSTRGQNDKWTVDSFLKDRKTRRDKDGNEIPVKSWRAHYVGAYVNYGTYAFKLTEKGVQGRAIGIGASAGYTIPMYEYRNGAVDVELGFSVGLQICERYRFIYDPYGSCYTQVLEKPRKDKMHMTPFPVVSDARVAFVWRHKSIKDKVKEDDDRNRVERYFNRIEADYNYNDCTKERLDMDLENTLSSRDRRAVMENDSLYREKFNAMLANREAELIGFIPNAFPGEFKTDPRVHEIVMEYEDRLEKLIEKRKGKALRAFESAWSDAKAESRKAADKAAKEQEKAKEQASAAKGDGEPEARPAKAEKAAKVKEPKEPKAPKEPKVKKQKEDKDNKEQ